MTTAQFRRASLVPFDAGGKNTEEGRAIPLDFNPETLTLKVSGGEQKDKGRKGRQQVQNVGSSKATLSFECVFDSTRPRDSDTGEGGGGEEMLDVRVRTKPIADLVQTYGSGKEQAPRRVQFRWGTLLFNGVISSHQEVFEYFSPSGVPLRSKLQLTLTEQEFRYEVNASDAAQRRQAVEQAASDARSQASAAGAGSLLGGGANGGAGFDLSAGFELSASLDVNLDMSLSAQVGLSASLGASADIGMAVGAGIHLDASAAIDLFGPAALGSAPGDLGRSGLTVPRPSPGLAAAGVPPNPWAPDGPAPGSKAAGLAAAVSSQRAAGAIAPAPGAATPAAAPLPVRGSPPLALRRSPPAGSPLFASRSTPIERAAGERRPRWESLPNATATPAAAAHAHPAGHTHCSCGGCGCRRCCGG
ncbi:hypothetical protein [Zoogloea sp.]|uniref:CIS tube protein n=1 Tax=Zoogloea sp. TaxID=49181 RepID=UPI0025CDFE59|nr:hypothetical protein [Zoogloea sp.]